MLRVRDSEVRPGLFFSSTSLTVISPLIFACTDWREPGLNPVVVPRRPAGFSSVSPEWCMITEWEREVTVILPLSLTLPAGRTKMLSCREKNWDSTTPAKGVAMATSIKDDGSWTGLCENTHTHTIQALTGEVNHINYLVTLTPVTRWDISGSRWAVTSGRWWRDGSRKNGTHKSLSDFDKLWGLWRSQSVSKMAALPTVQWCLVGMGGTLENSNFQSQSAPSQRGRSCGLLILWLNRVALARWHTPPCLSSPSTHTDTSHPATTPSLCRTVNYGGKSMLDYKKNKAGCNPGLPPSVWCCLSHI